MPHLIIDPPVGPFSSISELNAWRDELTKMKRKYRNDATALRSVLSCLEDVETWITLSATGLKDDSRSSEGNLF